MRSRSLRILTLGVFFSMTGVTLVAPMLPLYAREFGVSRTAAGVLVSSFAIARLVFDPIGGVLSDRIGPRRVMVAGGLVLAASSVSAALAPNYGVLVISRIVEGFGSAAWATAALHAVVSSTPKERMGRAVAFYQTGLLGGIAVGPFLGGRAAELGDFATPFWVYAVIGLAITALALAHRDGSVPRGRSAKDFSRVAGGLIRSRPFQALLFVSFAVFVMRAGARVTLIPLYGSEELGLSESQIGDVLALSAVVTVLIINPGGWLVDRIGRRLVLVTGLAGTALTVVWYGAAESYGMLLVVSAVFGVVAGLMGIVPPTLAGDLAPPGGEGAAVGVYRTAGDLGLLVGPILLGSIAESGEFFVGFVVSAVLLLAAAGVASTIGETRHRPGTEAHVRPV